ncbi:MAG: hypothetical protein KDJ29_00670, partial [Hyphomicrobiales bacterium]|nr:hypothetical protein [Hyphomicrobiales bacterium]
MTRITAAAPTYSTRWSGRSIARTEAIYSDKAGTMKILVAGVGGIGGWLAGSLARGGADVTLFARGLTLGRLREDGLTLQSADSSET